MSDTAAPPKNNFNRFRILQPLLGPLKCFRLWWAKTYEFLNYNYFWKNHKNPGCKKKYCSDNGRGIRNQLGIHFRKHPFFQSAKCGKIFKALMTLWQSIGEFLPDYSLSQEFCFVAGWKGWDWDPEKVTIKFQSSLV